MPKLIFWEKKKNINLLSAELTIRVVEVKLPKLYLTLKVLSRIVTDDILVFSLLFSIENKTWGSFP